MKRIKVYPSGCGVCPIIPFFLFAYKENMSGKYLVVYEKDNLSVRSEGALL
jgi:hypothetical protein